MQLLSEDQFLHVHSNAPLDPLPLSSFLSRPHPDAQASVRMHACAHCWTTHACGNLCDLLSYSRVQWGVGRDWVQSAAHARQIFKCSFICLTLDKGTLKQSSSKSGFHLPLPSPVRSQLNPTVPAKSFSFFLWQKSIIFIQHIVASHQEGPGFKTHLLVGAFMFYLCLNGFSPGTPAPSHSIKTCMLRLTSGRPKNHR